MNLFLQDQNALFVAALIFDGPSPPDRLLYQGQPYVQIPMGVMLVPMGGQGSGLLYQQVNQPDDLSGFPDFTRLGEKSDPPYNPDKPVP